MAHPRQHSTAQRGTAHQRTSCSQQVVAALSQHNAFALKNKPGGSVSHITLTHTQRTHAHTTTYLTAQRGNRGQRMLHSQPWPGNSNALTHSTAWHTKRCCIHRTSPEQEMMLHITPWEDAALTHVACSHTQPLDQKKPCREDTPNQTPYTTLDKTFGSEAYMRTSCRQNDSTANTHTQARCTQHTTYRTCRNTAPRQTLQKSPATQSRLQSIWLTQPRRPPSFSQHHHHRHPTINQQEAHPHAHKTCRGSTCSR
jgi:hypothetical protein